MTCPGVPACMSPRAWKQWVLEAWALSKACVPPSSVGSTLGVLAQGGCSVLCANKVGTVHV